MRRTPRLVLLLAIPALLAAAPAAPPKADLAISNVVASKRAFRPGAGESLEWRFHVSAPCSLTVSLWDARNVLVRRLFDKRAVPAGDQRLTWDGLDDRGRPVPPAYYLLTADAVAGSSTVTWDPSDSTGGGPATPSFLGYDAKTGLVRYAVIRPSLVRILAGLSEDGPVLRTIVDWVARDAGANAEPWDGWDASHVAAFGSSPKLDVQVWASELPVNAVVVLGPQAAAAGDPVRMAYLEFDGERPRRAAAPPRPHEMYNHWQHPRDRCHDPRARLVVPADAVRDAKGAVTVDWPMPLSLEIPADDAAYVQNERFEVVIYIDGSYVFEEEQGYLPFTWTLAPEQLAAGEHVITYMVRGYEGHFGSASIRVVRPASPK